MLLAAAGGATALVTALTGSLVAAAVAGLLVLATALVVIRVRMRDETAPDLSLRPHEGIVALIYPESDRPAG